MEITQETLDQILTALGEHLEANGAPQEIVVIGGSALLALGFVSRPTRDVDVLGLAESGELRPASPLPPALLEARDRVGRDFELGENWLNSGPTDLLRWGLPNGFWDRLTTRQYEADLRALEPTQEELIAAAKWTTTHDPSPGFRTMLMQALHLMGVENDDLGP